MKNGSVLYSTHPYSGGNKFIARLEKDGISKRVSKQTFLSIINKGFIVKSDTGTNREYVYQLIEKILLN